MQPRLNLAGIEEHPLREHLNNEFHARPPIPLLGAMLVSHLVFKHSATAAQETRRAPGAFLCFFCKRLLRNAIFKYYTV